MLALVLALEVVLEYAFTSFFVLATQRLARHSGHTPNARTAPSTGLKLRCGTPRKHCAVCPTTQLHQPWRNTRVESTCGDGRLHRGDLYIITKKVETNLRLQESRCCGSAVQLTSLLWRAIACISSKSADAFTHMVEC